MADIVTANCEVAHSHLESAKKKVQQLELLSKKNTEKKYLKNQEELAKTEAALEKANMSKNSANEKICEMRLTIKNLEKESKKLSRLNTSLTSSHEMLEKEQYINLEQIRHEKHKLQKRFSYSQKRLKQYTAGLGDPNKRGILEEIKRLTSENKDLQQLVQITTKCGRSYSFGLCEVASGDVAATMNAFCVAVDDLSAAIGNDVEKDKRFAMLVSSIKSTMSDLGPVNPGYNSQFQLLRQTLLSKAMENWNILQVEQK